MIGGLKVSSRGEERVIAENSFPALVTYVAREKKATEDSGNLFSRLT